MLSLSEKRILVTGGNGFLGRAVVRVLRQRGCEQISAPHSSDGDLRYQSDAHRLFWDIRPEVVFHLAARCGGIGANMAAPGQFIYDNLAMGLNVIEMARVMHCCQKLVLVGTVCSYPEHNDGPITEADLWNGYPERTNAPYGIAKRCLGEVLKAYHAEYGMKSAYVICANLYGPGDNIDLETSHVIPAMIRKFHESQRNGSAGVDLWGSGNPTRDFLYVDDAAEAIVRAAERVESPEPINVGTGRETSIREVAYCIARLYGSRDHIRWDATKPGGQPRRVLATERCNDLLGWAPVTRLEDGLRETVEWWTNENRLPGEFRRKPGLFGVPDPISKQ